MQMICYSIKIQGIVQGVGFRPFIFRLANLYSLNGFVQNTAQGVYIEIEGDSCACNAFLEDIETNAPSLSQISNLKIQQKSLQGFADFVIIKSSEGLKNALISPDIGICEECKKDIADKNNRRYNYAFTNCTNCGPRYTIIQDIPYDRKNTTMSNFVMCPDCQKEYDDPNNRRFHAQPNACPVCGPSLSLYKDGNPLEGDHYMLFDDYINRGKIVSVKGIGGYHLCCDGKNQEAVKRLRQIKHRYEKPFAVMMRDINTVKLYCDIDDLEEEALLSSKKPIVLLKKKCGCYLSNDIAPDNDRLGVMLAYTPLHCILMQNHDVIVMTSANISDCPMVYNDNDINLLYDISDAVLTHNRQILRRMDDSVCMVMSGKVRMIRRARGYVPRPVIIKNNEKVILALGAQQKNTFCLTSGENAFLSGHIGDLDDIDTMKFYESEIQSYTKIFEVKPEIIVCDMHPDYISTNYAEKFKGKLPIYKIQHHHAHFASVLAENNIEKNAIGIIFDGTGYGEDGCLWGGEALFGGIATSARIGHMLYAPMPGTEAAIREPWRMALSMMKISCGEQKALDFFYEHGDKAGILINAINKGINSPLTSGAGRLFDAVAALVGIKANTTYEGQAAIEFEQVIDKFSVGSYNFDIVQNKDMFVFDWRQLICDVVCDVKKGARKGEVSAKFHNAVINLIVDIAVLAQKKYDSNIVALSGGVFQNFYLLSNVTKALDKKGFLVYLNEEVPTNDAGISFGQAASVSRLIMK